MIPCKLCPDGEIKQRGKTKPHRDLAGCDFRIYLCKTCGAELRFEMWPDSERFCETWTPVERRAS